MVDCRFGETCIGDRLRCGDVGDTQSDLDEFDRARFAEAGGAAFTSGTGLSTLIGAYLEGAGEIWENLFSNADPGHTVELGRSLRRVSEQAVSLLAEGFEAAQRLSIRAEESLRRSFLDDLLSSETDRSALVDAGRKIGFPAFAGATVVVADTDRYITDSGPVHRRMRTELESRAPHRDFRVTAKNGMLVIIALDTAARELTNLLQRVFTPADELRWHLGIGNSAATLDAIAASYTEALEAHRIGTTFGLPSPTEFARILPQRILSADMAAAEALVCAGIEPLRTKSKGDLLATLEAFIEHSGNMAEVARALDIGARTVAYRLDRIAEITGYSWRIPDERFVLELAYRAVPLVQARERRRLG